MKIGNIVFDGNIEVDDTFNVVKTIEECLSNIPTLIVGWSLTKSLFGSKVSILRKEIDELNFWTFNPNEKTTDYERDLVSFMEHAYNKLIKNTEYYFIDPIIEKRKYIKRIISKIYNTEKVVAYIHEERLVYLFVENVVFGLDLKLLEFIGLSKEKMLRKIKSVADSSFDNENIFTICKECQKYINNGIRFLPYIYYLERYG